MYKLSVRGIADLKSEEGLRLEAYFCASGKLTIGYGHRLYDSKTMSCTRAQAEEWFKEDTQRVLEALWADSATLNQNQVDALTSFIFNIGINAWNGSTARIDVGHRNYKDVPFQLKRWVHDDHNNVIPGLVTRRYREAATFTKAVT